MPSSRRWLPFEGEGEPGQAGSLKQNVVALGKPSSSELHCSWSLVGKKGEIDWQGLAFLGQQELGS